LPCSSHRPTRPTARVPETSAKAAPRASAEPAVEAADLPYGVIPPDSFIIADALQRAKVALAAIQDLIAALSHFPTFPPL